jgi:hypothetical protein
MQQSVISLQRQEVPEIQTEALHILQRNLGREASRDVIERAIYELSDRLCQLEYCLKMEKLVKVRKLAVGMIAISDQIGMTSISMVCSDLVRCIDQQNATATAAVANRLINLGETSMFEAVEFADWPA